ncbi:MAG: RnfABCDGE type electron transport complex subunit D [bacterium]
MDDLLLVSAGPHIHSRMNINRATCSLFVALTPSLIFSSINFGLYALVVVITCIASCIISELICDYIKAKKLSKICDGTPIITGMLLGMSLPPAVPLWIPVIGGAFSIIIVKKIFGGLGFNLLNPALTGRAFLVFSFPLIMTTAWHVPVSGTVSGIDTISQATPMMILKNPEYYGDTQTIINTYNSLSFLKRMFFGNIGGSIGETCKLAIILGGIVLLYMKIIDYKIVLGYLSSFLIFSIIFLNKVNPIFSLLSGGVLLAIFFMATDWVTTPITKNGRWIFGIGCGFLTIFFRSFSLFPDGVTPAILIMNICTPLIDKITMRIQ